MKGVKRAKRRDAILAMERLADVRVKLVEFRRLNLESVELAACIIHFSAPTKQQHANIGSKRKQGT